MKVFSKSGRTAACVFAAALTMSFFYTPCLWANQAAQIPQIMGRGLVNVVSSPFEAVRTPIVESGQHQYLWPFSFGFRAVRNFAYRLTSGIYDIGFYPLATPFLDETPPLTDKMGLSNYIWQNEDAY